MTFEGHFSYCKRFYCLYLKNTAYLYEVNYNVYCRIRPQVLICNTECNLLAIAKFLVLRYAYRSHGHYRTRTFLSPVNILTRDIDIAILFVCPSVCPSVCPFVRPSVRCIPVFYGNGLRYCHNFFTTL